MIRQDWKNKDNRKFYAGFSQAELRRYEKPLGLAGAPELDITRNYWKNSHSVMELGAGEGRVIEGLLQRSYQGQIYAVERQTSFLRQLHKKYQNNSQVNIIEEDILQPMKLPEAEIGLWLWAGMLEFSPQEQQRVLRNLERYIEQTLIVETPALGSKTNATTGEEQWLEIHGENERVLHGYLPSEEDFRKYTSGTQWNLSACLFYEIVKDKKRVLYILQKTNN